MAKSGEKKQTLGNRVKQLEELLMKVASRVDRADNKIIEVANESNRQHEDTRARIVALENEVK